MRETRYVRILRGVSLLALVLISAAGRAQGDEMRNFSSRIADAGWQSKFEEVLNAKAAEDRIPAFSLRMVYRMLGDSPVQDDPSRAAERVALFARFFDEDLRKGFPPQSTMAAYRQCWRSFASDSDDGDRERAGDGARIRASLKAVRDKIAKENANRGASSNKRSPGGKKNPGQGQDSGDAGPDGGDGNPGGSGTGGGNSGGGGK